MALIQGSPYNDNDSINGVFPDIVWRSALNGTADGDLILGLQGVDILNGQGGNDILQGGEGDDFLYGKLGDDTLLGETENDHLRGGEGDDFLDGGSGDDILEGEAGHDTLMGGLGRDRLFGGSGNDTYLVNDTTDALVEFLNDGFDTVQSSISFGLPDNVEKLVLTGNNMSEGIGNSLDNLIVGNSASNTLNGREGHDSLQGLAGDDFLDGWDGNDSLEGGEGNDELLGWFGHDVLKGGQGDDILAGEADQDSLLGDVGQDRLIGGFGNDWLVGGVGADQFVFNRLAEGVDTISDFTWSEGDKIVVSARGFGGNLVAGTLSQDQFTTTGAAVDATTRFIYNSSTGAMFFDADGTGASPQVQFATLAAGLNLISSDITVVD